MTAEAQNLAISDATGLCPKCDYVNDLNAVHEAEKKLSPAEWQEYASLLRRWEVNYPSGLYGEISLPAKVRAEMFLRVKRKWVD